jgi:hypothetical protein
MNRLIFVFERFVFVLIFNKHAFVQAKSAGHYIINLKYNTYKRLRLIERAPIIIRRTYAPPLLVLFLYSRFLRVPQRMDLASSAYDRGVGSGARCA